MGAVAQPCPIQNLNVKIGMLMKNNMTDPLEEQIEEILSGLENGFYNHNIGREVFGDKLTRAEAKTKLIDLVVDARIDELDRLVSNTNPNYTIGLYIETRQAKLNNSRKDNISYKKLAYRKLAYRLLLDELLGPVETKEEWGQNIYGDEGSYEVKLPRIKLRDITEDEAKNIIHDAFMDKFPHGVSPRCDSVCMKRYAPDGETEDGYFYDTCKAAQQDWINTKADELMTASKDLKTNYEDTVTQKHMKYLDDQFKDTGGKK